MHLIYNLSVILVFSFAAVVFMLLFYISAPYGKFLRDGWGPTIKSRWAWLIMESPSPILMTYFFLTSDNKSFPGVIFISLWLLHYIHRTLIYPFTQSGRDKSYPFILVSFALIFNCLNGFINGYGVFHIVSYNSSWLSSWQFVTGSVIFISGFVINKISDEKLRRLRKESPAEYVLPHGWLFELISSPHYFGEIIEWGGWAIMTWSLPGLAFFVFTFANLLPRGVSSHRWYRLRFREYPKERKAVIPFII